MGEVTVARQSTQRARSLRSGMTDAERALWARLRHRQLAGHRFRRQYVIHPYIVDFVRLERRLIVEVDGNQHAAQREYDVARDEFLRREGFRVLWFSDRETLTEVEGVIEAILEVATLPPP